MWLNPSNPQLDKKGRLHHLLTLEGLPAEILWQILDTAKSFLGTRVKKVPLLRGKSVFNLFFEPSTRTRTTFEIAAKRRASLPTGCSAPSVRAGTPTTSCAGRHSAINRSIAAKRARLSAAVRVVRGWARRVSKSPTATPMRRVPKSNARTVPVLG